MTTTTKTQQEPKTSGAGGRGNLPPHLERLFDDAGDLFNNKKISEDQFKEVLDYIHQVADGKRKADDLPKGFKVDEEGNLHFSPEKKSAPSAPTASAEEDAPRKKTVVNTLKGFGSTTVATASTFLLLKKLVGDEGALVAATLVGGAYVGAAAVSFGASAIGGVAQFFGKAAGIKGLQEFGEKAREFSGDLWAKTNDVPKNLISQGIELIKENSGALGNIAGMGMLSKVMNGFGGKGGPAAAPAR